MSEECADTRIDELAAAAALLGWRLPRLRDPGDARQWALALHVLLVHLAKGRGAIDLAVCEGLYALSVGHRAMNLGYSSAEDYAREELGLNASTAAKMRRLAESLRDLVLIREAVRRGEVTPRKAEIVARVATPGNEALWLLRMKECTVRELRAEVDAPREADEEERVRLCLDVAPQNRPLIDEGLELAGIVLDKPTATTSERVMVWCEEFLGGHPSCADDGVDNVLFNEQDAFEELKEHLEQQHGKWAELEVQVTPVHEPQSGEIDPWRIDAELRALVKKRDRWEEVLGRVAMLFQSACAWEHLGLASFGHYCEEQLGIAGRTVEQRVALERALGRNPLLRQALREKRLSYEKARLIARHVAPDEMPAWIERAGKLTCIDLRRQLEHEEERQMCARGVFSAWMPVSIAELLKGTFRAVRAMAKRFLWAEECLITIVEHFVKTYEHLFKQRKTLWRRIRDRDRHLCQVPGCSRPATHTHHIRPRAQGGPDEEWNLISLCTAHHLRGIHDERMRLSGKAPDRVVWEFGLRRSYAATAVP